MNLDYHENDPDTDALRALYDQYVVRPSGHTSGPEIAVVPENLSHEVQDAMDHMGSVVIGVITPLTTPGEWVGVGPHGENILYTVPLGHVGILGFHPSRPRL